MRKFVLAAVAMLNFTAVIEPASAAVHNSLPGVVRGIPAPRPPHRIYGIIIHRPPHRINGIIVHRPPHRINGIPIYNRGIYRPGRTGFPRGVPVFRPGFRGPVQR